MLASAVKFSQITYPVWATPKLDGIRCIIKKGCPVSRNFKPIRNAHICSKLANLPSDLDGELILKNIKGNFNEVSSAVMSEDGSPEFVYSIFDYVPDPDVGYLDRIELLKKHFQGSFKKYYTQYIDYIELILPVEINSEEELKQYEAECLAGGYEGVMLRSADSPYKYGRSTAKQGWLLKLKRFKDSEAVIVGFVEKITNQNEATKDKLGYTKRSSCKANLVPAGTLGTLKIKDVKTGMEFGLGSGLDDELRKEIWENQEEYLGRIVKYKYQPSGAKDLPRFPVFLGFRDKNDM